MATLTRSTAARNIRGPIAVAVLGDAILTAAKTAPIRLVAIAHLKLKWALPAVIAALQTPQ